MTAAHRLRRLPGGWFAVAGRADWWRAELGQVALVWMAPWPMMLIGRVSSARMRHRIERTWARAASRVLGLRLRIRGFEHVDPRRRYLIIALHEGLADPLVLWHLPLPLRFVGRAEFLDWPVVGAYLRVTGQLMVSPQLVPLRAARASSSFRRDPSSASRSASEPVPRDWRRS